MAIIVYKALLNEKIKYIGVTSKSLAIRKSDHLYEAFKRNSPYLFHKAIRKYGKESLKFEQLELVSTKEEAFFLETYYIKHFGTYAKESGYNLTLGGEGGIGKIMSPEARLKISNSKKGKPGNKHYKVSSETKAKLKAAWANKATPQYRNISVIDESGVIYKSIADASKLTGIKRTTINQSLSQNRSLRNGKTFKYYSGV